MKKHLLPHILIISFVLLCNFGCSAILEGVAEGLLEAYIETEKAGSAYKSYNYDVSGYNQDGVAVVVFYPSGCDYFIADGSKGFYLLEWYSGYDPSEGDLIVGDIGSYGFKDVYYPKQDRTGRVYVEDYLLSESSVIEEYNDQCD